MTISRQFVPALCPSKTRSERGKRLAPTARQIAITDRMASSLNELIARLSHFAHLNNAERSECLARAGRLVITSDEELQSALDGLVALSRIAPSGAGDGRRAATHAALVAKLAERLWAGQKGVAFSPQSIARLRAAYLELPAKRRLRHHISRALATEGSKTALDAFVGLLAAASLEEHAALAFVPLFQRPTAAVAGMFPRILDHLDDPTTATLILDLANFLTRRSLVERHPAHERAERLAALLGGLVDRLKKLEETPEQFAPTAAALSKMVAESISLSIALCDALALIGEASAAAQLYKALDVAHRRLRTEAAAALATLGQSAGIDALVQLTTSPASRTRALAYLEEFGRLDRVAVEHRTNQARAEGDLSEWLAQTTQYGAPPQEFELIDASRQYWPGYDEQVDCFLFRYTYRLPQGELCGIGIAGPLTHSFDADLEDYPPGDILAAYAGWQTEHPEIQEIDADDLAPELTAAANRVAERLRADDYGRPSLAKVGLFFGERVFVFTAVRANREGVAVVDDERIEWYPGGTKQRPLTPALAYYMHKGRKILKTFNPPPSSPADQS